MRRNHRDLRVWQEAIGLVEMVYESTRTFPADEQFGLSAQMRRAAVSAPSNIAEGFARGGTKELLRYLTMAGASLSELDTHLELVRRLKFTSKGETLQSQVDKVSALLAALKTSLTRSTRPS